MLSGMRTYRMTTRVCCSMLYFYHVPVDVVLSYLAVADSLAI